MFKSAGTAAAAVAVQARATDKGLSGVGIQVFWSVLISVSNVFRIRFLLFTQEEKNTQVNATRSDARYFQKHDVCAHRRIFLYTFFCTGRAHAMPVSSFCAQLSSLAILTRPAYIIAVVSPMMGFRPSWTPFFPCTW